MGFALLQRNLKPVEEVKTEKPTPTPPTPKKTPGRPKKQAEEVAKDE